MSAEGEGDSGAQRVTFKGGYNVSPRISPDGKLLAYISRVGGAFKLYVQDMSNGDVTGLTDTSYDESPSFAANGKFLPGPDHVRAQGFDPRDKYAYYCKIEVQVPGASDPELVRQRAGDFLSAMLPEIMACLPDWTDVTEGRWPEENPTQP